MKRYKESGYCDCGCLDCFEIAICSAGGKIGEVLCNECEAAGCEGGENECDAPGAYGGEAEA